MTDIFLSYTEKDRVRAGELVAAFEQRGLSVFWDRRIPPGRTWDEYIQEQIDNAGCVVVLWSQDSVNSRWVKIEASEGLSTQKLVPARIANVRPPLEFRYIQCADLQHWRPEQPDDEFEALLQAISRIIGRAITPLQQPKRESNTAPAQPERKTTDPPEQTKPKIRSQPQPPDTKDFVDPVCGVRFLYVPGGEFMMGSDTWTDSKPVHPIVVSPFWMAETTITNAQYAKYLADQKNAKKPRYWDDEKYNNPQQPVVGVDWNDAVEFCGWLSSKTDKPIKLPSEAQWEFAARGPSNRTYPWGEQKPDNNLARFGLGIEENPAPVGSFPAGKGPFGHLDLAGNVWEWCEDVWNEKAYQEPGRRRDPVTTTGDKDSRSLRGGSYWYDAENLRSAYRHRRYLDDWYQAIGFRVVSAPRST